MDQSPCFPDVWIIHRASSESSPSSREVLQDFSRAERHRRCGRLWPRNRWHGKTPGEFSVCFSCHISWEGIRQQTRHVSRCSLICRERMLKLPSASLGFLTVLMSKARKQVLVHWETPLYLDQLYKRLKPTRLEMNNVWDVPLTSHHSVALLAILPHFTQIPLWGVHPQATTAGQLQPGRT